MKTLRRQPEGRSLQLIWLHLLVEAGKTNDQGWVYLTPDTPYTALDLADNFNEPVNFIEIALRFFVRLDMIDIDANGRILIRNWDVHQSVELHETYKERERRRKAEWRKKRAVTLLLEAGDDDGKDDSDTMSRTLSRTKQGHVPDCPRLDRELDLDLEKDIKIKNVDHRPAKKQQIDAQCASSFNSFWEKYPNKKGKSKAWSKWQAYYKNGEINIDAILASVDDYIRFVEYQHNQRGFDMQYMHGVTYVNGKHWESDWSIPTIGTSRTREVVSDDDDPIAQLLQRVDRPYDI